MRPDTDMNLYFGSLHLLSSYTPLKQHTCVCVQKAKNKEKKCLAKKKKSWAQVIV